MSDIDIDALRDVEQSIGLRRPAFGRGFVQMDRWLVADSVALSKIALRKWRSLELLPLNSLDHWLELPRLDITRHSWLAARQNGGHSRLPLLCSALYQARRARRAFYLARRLTIKLHASRRGARMVSHGPRSESVGDFSRECERAEDYDLGRAK